MIAVTIGSGEKWRLVAQASAAQVERMTGLETHIIDSVADSSCHPSWEKLRIFDHVGGDNVLYFDADIWIAGKWNVEQMHYEMERHFMAAPDVASVPVNYECGKFGIPFPDCYVNAGLWVANRRKHESILQKAYARRPEFGSWLEQTALNLELIRSRAEVCRLPRTFNTLLWPGLDDYSLGALMDRQERVLHFASIGDPDRIAELQAIMAA